MLIVSGSAHKQAIFAHSEEYAASRPEWRSKASFFHGEDEAYLRFLIPKNARVLEIGCGIGDTLAALKPAHGVGIDFSPALVGIARERHPDLTFVVGDAEDPATIASVEGPFDYILVLDAIGSLDDCQKFLEQLHPLCTRETRVVIGYFSHLWQPVLKFAEWIGRRMPF
ncbi:MAG TPA: glycosyl transferase, partial [Afipia sp.]|nr:glycosyl transferase [Afipia sp.]